MITRIVRMQFQAELVHQFRNIFEQSCHQIRSMPGCVSLELFQDASDESVFYTISQWASIADLENYRNSELFAQTWSQTKVLFAAKPIAFSLKSVKKVE
ncbi:MAG: antibiotic biosynthesis monooxygenase [Bacteroidia bacterium]|nr:antibiotic biosynthesis monooxygenase [Bacteroidia bacterium]